MYETFRDKKERKERLFYSIVIGLVGRIRTCGICIPSAELYLTELRPANDHIYILAVARIAFFYTLFRCRVILAGEIGFEPMYGGVKVRNVHHFITPQYLIPPSQKKLVCSR